MTIKTCLSESEKRLAEEGIATARLDCLVLLEDVLGRDRAWILAHDEEEITDQKLHILEALVTRRAAHEPLAYIRGKTEFYGREFIVTPATLEPRPETETMIELCLDLAKNGEITDGAVIADIGSGSGAIAITIKQELPHITVLATEINQDALAIARQNARGTETEVEIYQGDLLEPILGAKLDVLLCNLPYVPDSHTINQAAMQEPSIAIFGGEDGLDLYRRLFEQIDTIDDTDDKPRFILAESLPTQHEALATLAKKHGYTQNQEVDFIQVFAHQ